ncbi:DUF1007 family protein [Hoeflea sp. EC-HK425]|uniref:DUF1007 family protein n=1 Tax=Hoeflea sp. EC-HK425 TaxID=2038388 RepID=UPI0012597635|nr:DUF1007 family protein [Hoeflea sp. EC-HK425]VVT27165.1 ABC transporter substrate-binding protein [Hoeflea sp. EC-HK425]|tara:strand:- start:1753 stop:2409 length:657 start_codon:yes stop_codon:yes gene_type:complete
MNNPFKWQLPALAVLAGLFLATPASAHPHVFAEARLEIDTSADGLVTELRNVWRFDEVFSSSVLLDFDENGDLQLDQAELAEISTMVTASLAEFDYYVSLSVDGRDAGISLPEDIKVDYQDGQLLMFFAVVPAKELRLSGKIAVGVFDPTMYAALDFINDEDMMVTGGSSGQCARNVVRPDPDEIIAQNQALLTEAFFETTQSGDLSKLLATRLELTC